MEIKLFYSDSMRISTNGGDNFIHVNGMDFEQGIRIDAHPFAHYIEVRKKERQLATFYFASKRTKKKMDLGWWQDAEVVFALNEINK